MSVFSVNNSNDRFTLKLTLTEGDYNITANTSPVTYKLELIANTSYNFSQYRIGSSVILDGVTVHSQAKSWDKQYSIADYGTLTLASGTTTIKHSDDGSKTISVYYGIEMDSASYTPGNLSDSDTMALTQIPRASTISCTTANIESKPTITIKRASSSFTHTIKYKFGTLEDTIATKTSATSITSWTIPSSFYAQIPNAKIGEGTLTCTTYSGSKQIGEPQTCKLSVTTDEAKCKPTVSGTVVDTNETTIALTGSSNKLVRYLSTALCTISTTLNKNAGSITTKTINNTSVSGTTRTIEKVETGSFQFYAKDSRGYYKTATVTKDIVKYIKLTNNASAKRTDPTSGKATITISGNYFNGSFGASNNTLTVKYRQGTSGTYTTVTPTITDNKYSATVSLTGLDYTKSFTYQVVVSDKASTVTKTLTIQKGVPVFDWGENDFNFNVPVTIKGVNILDKLAELESLIKS